MRVFLATAESVRSRVYLLKHNVQNVLFSYHIMNKGKFGINNYEAADKLLFDFKGKTIFCDSGAATLQKGITPKQFDDVVVAYGEFLKRYSKHFIGCAEMDIYNLFPKEKIQEVRRYLEQFCNNLIPVWHVNMGLKDWKAFLDNYSYVAVGITKLVKEPVLFRLVRLAYEAGVKVHGFAVTTNEKMINIPFFSVDSSTWINGDKYGEYQEYVNGKVMKFKNVRAKENIKRRKIEHVNVFLKPSLKTERNLLAFQKLEKHVTKLWAKRGVVWDG